MLKRLTIYFMILLISSFAFSYDSNAGGTLNLNTKTIKKLEKIVDQFDKDGSIDTNKDATFDDVAIQSDLGIGVSSHETVSVDGTTKDIQLGVHGDDTADEFDIYADRASDTHTSKVLLGRARGSHSSPSQVANGDILGNIGFLGFDGTDNDMNIGAHIQAVVDGTPGNDDLPTKLSFRTTADGSSTPTTRMTIGEDGAVDVDGSLRADRMKTETKTDTYSITTSDLGKSMRMNSASDKIFNLPSVGSSEDGARITCIKQGSGKLTISAADSDYIHDSSAGSTIESSTNYSTITLEYVDGMTRWVIISATGTWITS